MPKSSRRDRSGGALDRIRGSVQAMFGKVTGRNRHKAKGKATRLRGSARSKKGRAKARTRRAAR